MRERLSRLWCTLRSRLGVHRWEAMVCLCGFSLYLSILHRPAVGGRAFSIWLVIISMALAVSGAVLFSKILLVGASRNDSARVLVRRLERAGMVTARVFVYTSLLLYANGALDQSEPFEHAMEVSGLSRTQIVIGPFRMVSNADVRFSEAPRRVQRIVVYPGERRWLWVGEPIVAHLKSGFLGIPWVVKLERDERRYVDRVVKLMPTAGQAWKNLVLFELEHRRWDEAYAAAQKYLEAYPRDYAFALSTAAALGVASRNREAVSLLEPFLESRRDYELLNVVGWGLSKLGETERGIALLKASIPLDPDAFWAYYHLGYVFRNQGRIPEAIEMFERVLERRPGFPEVEKELSRLRAASNPHDRT